MTAEAASSFSSCPKCRHTQVDGRVACPRCGLVFSLWDPEKVAALVPLDERATSLWGELEQAWDDQDKHDAFAKYCSMAGLLPAAGRRYREYLETHADDAWAIKMRDRIVAMATASFGTPTMPPPPVTRTTWFWVVLGVFGLGGLVGALLWNRL